MDYSTTFVRHFSRLVSLLIHEGGNIDEQKMTLRAVVAMGKEGPVTVGVRDWDLLANDAPVASALTGVRDVAERMAGARGARDSFRCVTESRGSAWCGADFGL